MCSGRPPSLLWFLWVPVEGWGSWLWFCAWVGSVGGGVDSMCVCVGWDDGGLDGRGKRALAQFKKGRKESQYTQARNGDARGEGGMAWGVQVGCVEKKEALAIESPTNRERFSGAKTKVGGYVAFAVLECFLFSLIGARRPSRGPAACLSLSLVSSLLSAGVGCCV